MNFSFIWMMWQPSKSGEWRSVAIEAAEAPKRQIKASKPSDFNPT
jgi:hypothetical protein